MKLYSWRKNGIWYMRFMNQEYSGSYEKIKLLVRIALTMKNSPLIKNERTQYELDL